MNDSLFSTKDIVKYLIVAGLVYSILKMIPSQQIDNKDLLLVLSIITIGFVTVDCVFFKQNKKEGFAEDDPFALDLNIDIDALLKKKAEMQAGKATVQEKVKTAVQDKVKAEAEKVQTQAVKLDAQVAKTELKDAKAELKDATAELKDAAAELKSASSPGEKALAQAKLVKAKTAVSKVKKQVAKAEAKVDSKVKQALSKGVAVTPRSETPKSATPKSATPKSATPRSESPIADRIGRVVKDKVAKPEMEMVDRPVRKAISSAVKEITRPEQPSPRSETPRSETARSTKAKAEAPKVGCAMEVNKVKRELENEINKLKVQLNARAPTSQNGKIASKYFEALLTDLNERGVLDVSDIENIQLKMRSKLLSMEEVISSLEMLKKEGKARVRSVEGKVKDDKVYNELPSDFYSPLGDKIANEWDNEYTILNTNKWQVPMPRPPVCINTTPCKVCPSDASNYPVNLKQWDDSRYVTQSKINKKWADDQGRA